jgi:hypothetical protein
MAQDPRPSLAGVGVAAFAFFGLIVACGGTGDGSHTSAGSPARTGSSSTSPTATTPPQGVPDATQLTAHNCSGPAPSATARQLGRYFTIRPASDWTEAPPPQHTETQLLELVAPAGDGFGPTLIQFHSLLGPVHTVYGQQATAHSIAQQHAAAIAQEWSPDAVAGPVSDCQVGGEAAAAFGVSGDLNSASGTTNGKFFWIYVVHNDLLFKVIVVGNGGVGDQAIKDSLGMLGSLRWTF